MNNIRPHFIVTESNGVAEVDLVTTDAKVHDSIFLLKNAEKVHYSEEVIKAYETLKNSKDKVRDLKELVAADLKSRSEDQISIWTKVIDFIGSFFLSSFGYETTQDKIRTAFSQIIRKDYEGEKTISESPESPKSPEKEVKEEPKVRDEAGEDDTKAEQEAREQAEKQAKEKADRESQERQAQEDAERQAKVKTEQEAREQAEKQAKEKADKESQERQAKEDAESEAKAKADQQAQVEREKAAKEAAIKAEMEARSKEKFSTGVKKLPSQEEAERLEDLKDYKDSLRSMEEYKKDFKNIEMQQSLQALHRSNERKAAMNKEINDEVQEFYDRDSDKIIHFLNSNNTAEVFNIIRAYPEHLQDPFLEYVATIFSAKNYYLGRMFALSIADEKRRNEVLASRGLLNEFESFELSQTTEEGKKIAELIQNQKYEEALRSINDQTYVFWILSSAITNAISNYKFDEAQKLINFLQRNDLKAEFQRQLNGQINLVKIYNELIKQVSHTTMVTQELGSALELLKNGELDKAIDVAVTLPAQVLAYFCTQLVQAYIDRARYVEARELVKLVTTIKKDSGLIFDISPEAVYEECARALIARGDLEEGLRSASLLSEKDRLEFVDRHLEAFPAAAYIILSQLPNQDDRLLKVIVSSMDESIAYKALNRMQTPVLIDFGRLTIAAKFGSLPAFLECTNEDLMVRSIESFMDAFNKKIVLMNVKDIEFLEAKVDSLKDKELKKVLYGAIRSLYNRHPPNLAIGTRISKKIKGLS